VVDFAVTADWTPATGDTKISKDGGNFANTTNNPSAVGGTGSAGWTLTVTNTELSAAEVNIQVIDAATKAVEDQWLTIYTFGNASALIKPDLSDSVRFGLTALPNAAAEAAGGLYTRGTGAGQLNQAANGQIDANLVRILNSAASATNLQRSVDTVLFDTVTNAGFSPTSTEFETSAITEATLHHYIGREAYWLTGALAGQRATVNEYALSGGRAHWTVSQLTDIPANGDTLIFL
jgi:hypothetical protein